MMFRVIKSALITLIIMGGIPSAEAGVALGATRLIYPSDQKQVTLGVSSNDENGTFLIQSWVENADGKRDADFIITPPLFVIHGKKENTLRVIDTTNKQLPQDRESLFWMNVKAIPSLEKSQIKANTLQLAITSRIKLFYRPVGLNMPPEKAPLQLRFNRDAGSLIITNPTPYFITVTGMKAGELALENTMVPAMGSSKVKFPINAGNTVIYRAINDYGAITQVMNGVVH